MSKRIQESRQAQGLTVEELAAGAGIKARTLRSYEQGSRLPGIDTLAAIAGALRVPCGVLMGDPVPMASETVPMLVRAEGASAVLAALSRFV